MDPVKVPQHLELDDVVAWGLGPVDLLFVVAGVGVGWWLYLALSDETALRVLAAAPSALIGLALGLLRVGELGLREWLAIAAAYAMRPRVLVTGAAS